MSLTRHKIFRNDKKGANGTLIYINGIFYIQAEISK